MASQSQPCADAKSARPETEPSAAERIEADAKLYRYMLEVAKANGFDSLTDAITKARKAETCLAYAQRLATVAASHYGPPEGWKPLADLYGVLTQIDNALTGLALAPALDEIDEIAAPDPLSDFEVWVEAGTLYLSSDCCGETARLSVEQAPALIGVLQKITGKEPRRG